MTLYRCLVDVETTSFAYWVIPCEHREIKVKNNIIEENKYFFTITMVPVNTLIKNLNKLIHLQTTSRPHYLVH